MTPTQEIINNVKQLYSLSWISPKLKSALENDFPELKESEDERIRKELLEEIEFIIPHDDETDSEGLILPSYHARIDRYKSYLEKQKEQQDVKVISWREPDDCTDIPEGHYVVIAYKPGVFGLGYIENGKVVCAPGQKPSGILYIPNADESIIVESKEQKPTEWSEEEKMHLYNAIEAVKYVYDVSEGTGGFKCVEFLKSLRPQPHWKPSKKQMEALEDAFRKDGGNEYRKVINSLYCDLQKLL